MPASAGQHGGSGSRCPEESPSVPPSTSKATWGSSGEMRWRSRVLEPLGEPLGPVGPRLPGACGGGSGPRSSLAGVSQGSSPSSAPPAYRDRRVGLALASRPADPTRGGGRGHLPGMSSFLPRGYLGPGARLLANGARLASSPAGLLPFPLPRARPEYLTGYCRRL